MTEKSITFRPPHPEDGEVIRGLFETCFKRPMNEAYRQWRYFDAPAGESLVTLAWDGDRLAGHYGLTPVRVRIAGEDCVTGLTVTAMIHGDYRGLGLWPRMANDLHRTAAERGFAMVWAFPNPISHRMFSRELRFTDIHEIPMLRYSLEGGPRLDFPGGKVTEPGSFDERFDRLWARVRDRFPVATVRDSAYLRWRFELNPVADFRTLVLEDNEEILGYLVFKRYCNELQVVDCLTTGEAEVLPALMGEALRTARTWSAESVSMWLSCHLPEHHELERRGFANNGPVVYFSCRELRGPSETSSCDLADYRNWHVTLGDSDVEEAYSR